VRKIATLVLQKKIAEAAMNPEISESLSSSVEVDSEVERNTMVV
jgi:hypothetical protein